MLLAVTPLAGFALAAGGYPEALSWSPTGADVPLDAKIHIDWSMAMDTASVEAAFYLYDGTQTWWGRQSFAWDHSSLGPYASEATPLFSLNSSTTYTVTVLPTATDASGTRPLDQDRDGLGGELTDALFWSFTTEDTTPPRLGATSPTDGQTGVAVTANVYLVFSEDMDAGSVADAFEIMPSVAGLFLWNPPYTGLTFEPALNLRYATTYTVTVRGSAKDVAGNPLDGDGDGVGGDSYAFSFTTEADAAPPRVLTVNPPNGTASVSVSADVTIQFSEGMDRSSVEGAIRLWDGTNLWTKVDGTFRWSSLASDDDTVTFNPYANWPFAAAITASLNASFARDLASFGLDGDADGASEGSPADDYSWSFSTEAFDTTPPHVAAVGPAPGAFNVSETTDIILSFSEAMDRQSVEDAFALISAARTWTKADGSFAWVQGSEEVAYQPSSNLAFGTTYAVELAATAIDVNLNALDGNDDGTPGDAFVSSFTTRAEPDAVPPSVLSTVPPHGATGAPTSIAISITFDDAMDRNATTEAIVLDQILGLFVTRIPIGGFEWSAADHTVTFLPGWTGLDWDAFFRVTVSQAARDDGGNPLPIPYSFEFRTSAWSGRVIGRVYEGDSPVAAATVTLGNQTTQTNATGEFVFASVATGEYTVTVAKAGYVTSHFSRTISEGTVTLPEETIDLGRIRLHRTDAFGPAAAAAILAAIVAALLVLALLLRRRRQNGFQEHFEELEPEDAEAER